MTRVGRILPAFVRDRRAVAIVEFAIVLPFLVLATLYLFELCNYIMVREQLSQLALQIADNAARIGNQTSIQTQIDEKQIKDLFTGADLQGDKINLAGNGRIILSSLEIDPDAPHGQFIHWQRCAGTYAYTSSYGDQGTGKGRSDFTGMGPGNGRITATDVAPIMYVEIGYRYTPLISSTFAPSLRMQEVAAMMVRDNRDTSDPGVNPVQGVTPARCTN